MLKKEYKFLLLLIAVCCLFFYQVFLLGKIPFPGDLLAGEYNPWRSYSFLGFAPGGMPNKAQYFDVIRQLYPWKMLAIESFKHFKIPLWNPYNFSGTPLLANNQSSVWYPLNILYFLFPQFLAWSILVVLQPLLASIGTYLFTRKIGIGKWGSTLSSIAYGYSLFQTVFLEYNTIGHVVALLPWTLLGVEFFLHNKKNLGSLLLVSSIAFSFFAGHIQLWGFAFLFVVVYAFFRVSSFKNKLLLSLELLFLLVLACAITGVQLLSTLELINNAARVSQNYSFLINNLLLQPYQLLVVIIPDIFGNPATRNYLLTDSYPGKAFYIGILPLLFALYSFARIKTNKSILFFTGAVITLLFFLVRTPFTQIFYTMQIPFFSTGSPSNALFLVSFSLAILAGFGLEYYLEQKNKKILALLFVAFIIFPLTFLLSKTFHIQLNIKNITYSLSVLCVGSLLIFIGSFFKKRNAFIAFCLVLLTILDLFYFFNKFNSFVKPALVYPSISVISTLQRLTGSQRVWSYGSASVEPNVLSMFHLSDTQGYDPLYPKVYGEFISSSQDGKIHTAFTNQSRSDATIAPAFTEDDLDKNPYRLKVLNATSVGYILSKNMLSNDFLKKSKWELTSSEGEWHIYHNGSALPHAYIVRSSDTYATPQEFARKFYAETFNPSDTVLLEKHRSNLSGTTGEAKILQYSPEKVTMQTTTDGKEFLVLTDTYFPGWKALVDGKEASIFKANFTFRGVDVPAGVHTITFLYQPRSFSLGVTLTIMGVVGLALYIIVVRKIKDGRES